MTFAEGHCSDLPDPEGLLMSLGMLDDISLLLCSWALLKALDVEGAVLVRVHKDSVEVGGPDQGELEDQRLELLVRNRAIRYEGGNVLCCRVELLVSLLLQGG
jgi:hypothetical protein